MENSEESVTTIYLHVGPHKTASTSIQLFCRQNRDVLASNSVLYPEYPGSASYGHDGLVRDIETAKFDHVKVQISGILDIAHSKDFSRILFSAEDFSKPTVFAKFLEFFSTEIATPSLRLKIIYVLRDQVSRARSLLLQNLKSDLSWYSKMNYDVRSWLPQFKEDDEREVSFFKTFPNCILIDYVDEGPLLLRRFFRRGMEIYVDVPKDVSYENATMPSALHHEEFLSFPLVVLRNLIQDNLPDRDPRTIARDLLSSNKDAALEIARLFDTASKKIKDEVESFFYI